MAVCECGCGLPVGGRPWRPARFLPGHNRGRVSPVLFVVEDRGYDTPCHVWARSLNTRGYGQMRIDGRNRSAHVVFFERAGGVIPEGHQIDHLCRVRACVNPAHMEAVTAAVNTQRGAVAKLTPDDVREIRARRAAGERLVAIADAFGITNQAVSHIARRQRWANVA